MEDLANKDPFLIDKNIVIALSGGIDSVVLLHFLNSHYPGNIRAVHINHNLSKHSKDWSLFCKELCLQQGVEFKSIDINLKNSKDSPMYKDTDFKKVEKFYETFRAKCIKNQYGCTEPYSKGGKKRTIIRIHRFKLNICKQKHAIKIQS